MMAKQTNSDRRQQGPRQGLSGEMPWACNRAKGASGLMGSMDGQRRGAEVEDRRGRGRDWTPMRISRTSLDLEVEATGARAWGGGAMEVRARGGGQGRGGRGRPDLNRVGGWRCRGRVLALEGGRAGDGSGQEEAPVAGGS